VPLDISAQRDGRHTQTDVEYIDFPGMLTLYDRFKEEAEELSPVSWDWSP